MFNNSNVDSALILIGGVVVINYVVKKIVKLVPSSKN